ncbi:MAG: methyltransferase domain-containing protein [Terriglobia bacterium]
MAGTAQSYLLAEGAAELERLTLQARTWEPEVEAMLDRIGVQPGWRCIDLGCGAMGILGPLGRRVGPSGKVVGLDADVNLLAAARRYSEQQGLSNVELTEGDAYRTGLPRESFDFVHVRFLLCPVGHDEELIAEMLSLVKPGGVIALEEPDSSSWRLYPNRRGFERLKRAIRETFRRSGGDFDAGQRTFGMLRRAGLEDVRSRAAVLALQDGHPYMRLPALFAASLRPRLLEAGLLTESELAEAVDECEHAARSPETLAITFTCMQVWGRKA